MPLPRPLRQIQCLPHGKANVDCWVALYRRIRSHQASDILPSTHRNQVNDQRTAQLGNRKGLLRLSAFLQCDPPTDSLIYHLMLIETRMPGRE